MKSIFQWRMILVKLFLFLFLKGILAFILNTKIKDSNRTERSGVQLWRIEGDFEKDVIDIFQERAHFTEEIWKRDNTTIDFLLFVEETNSLEGFLDAFNVSHKVLIDDVRQNVDEAMLARFPPKSISAVKDHKDMQLWRAQGNFDDEVLNTFYDRENNGEEIWVRDNRTIDFLMFKEENEKVTSYLKQHGMNYSVLIENVREKLDDDLLQTFPSKRNAVSGDSFTWTGFPALRDISAYLVKMATKYSSHCKLHTLGKTAHRKPIYMLSISNGNRNNKGLLVDGGTHGREWMSVMSTLYFIDSIVRNFSQQPPHITKMHWYIIPVLNPDGYEYSLSTDRLWKKNRRRLCGGCYGIDLNRNFDYNFDKADVDICDVHYGGPVPFSEDETKAFKKLADENHFYGYLSIHSAGSKVLYPLGTGHDEHSIHVGMTRQMAQAMRKVGNYLFVNGNMQRMGKKSYGMAMDWMYFIKGIQHSYVIETRGQNGLDYIQPKHILIAAKEVTAGLRKFAELL